MTLLFAGFAAVATSYGGLTVEASRYTLSISDSSYYPLIFVFAFSTVCTIVIDISCRTLVLTRSWILNVKYSKVRLSILRTTFCLALAGALAAQGFEKDLFTEAFEPFGKGILVLSFFLVPFSLSLMHLTPALRGYVKWALAIPFAYSLTSILVGSAFVLGVIFRIGIAFELEREQVRFYAFNTNCTIAPDKLHLSVKSDLLMKSEVYDAVSLNTEYIEAVINPSATGGGYRISLYKKDDGSKIIVSRNVINHLDIDAEIDSKTEMLLEKSLYGCEIQVEETISFNEPERVKTYRVPD